MTTEQKRRETESPAFEGPSALASHSRGRSSAPRFSPWLVGAAKFGGAALAAVGLAIVGVTAGAGPSASGTAVSPASSGEPPASSAPFAASPHAPVPAPVPMPRSSPGADAGVEPSASSASSDGTGVTSDGRIVLNAASEDELTRLPGIGPSRARAIVALRQRLARFRAIEDLLRVKGIGRKTLLRLKPKVVLDRPAAADGGMMPAR